MATLKSGRRVSRSRQARRALLNAATRASHKDDADEQVITLIRGITTAISWLDGTHPKLAGN
jgi:hypothetical protein